MTQAFVFPSRWRERRDSHLAHLGKARRDHTRFAGLKDRVVELVLSRLALIVGGIERGLRGAQRLLGLVIGCAGGEAGVDQGLLALVGRRRLLELGFGRLDARRGGFHVGLLGARIEASQDLVGHDMIADVHVALDDLAAEPKRQVVLDLRLDGPGQGHPRREIHRLGGNDVDAGQGGLRRPVVAATARQEPTRQQGGPRRRNGKRRTLPHLADAPSAPVKARLKSVLC
jgi:hypothetical protein